jgi:hypothetical protein
MMAHSDELAGQWSARRHAALVYLAGARQARR